MLDLDYRNIEGVCLVPPSMAALASWGVRHRKTKNLLYFA